MSGQYTQNSKKGFIAPIPKKGAPCNFSGEWPITMTSIFSTIYESFIAGWLKTSILHKIDPQKLGNIPKSSIRHYLASLLQKILKYLDKPERWVNLIAIDLK